jgi:hypothetical protein
VCLLPWQMHVWLRVTGLTKAWLLVLLGVLQDVGAEGISLQSLRLEGSAAAASRSGLQLFKPLPLPASAAAEGNAQRGLRGRGAGAAAAAGPGVPIVRAVDVYLSVHVDGMPPQVGSDFIRVMGLGWAGTQCMCTAVTKCPVRQHSDKLPGI